MFNVGDFVVALATWESPRYGGSECPVRGCVYTVREIELYRSGAYGLRLHELRNPPARFSDGVKEASFAADYFRPIRKQSIQIFIDIANGVKQPKKENA